MRDRNIYLIVLAFIVTGPFVQPEVIVTEMLIFGIVAVANNMMIGYTGMLSFGQAMFFGIGSYVAGLLPTAGRPRRSLHAERCAVAIEPDHPPSASGRGRWIQAGKGCAGCSRRSWKNAAVCDLSRAHGYRLN